MDNSKKTRIAIAGIGGIGGYIGGKLAHHYANVEEVEIIFIARGDMAVAIKKKDYGSTLMTTPINVNRY